METLVANIAGKVRAERLHGRDWLVAPATLIVAGVLDGSKGSGYYPPESYLANADDWNGMPLVAWHPKKDGAFVSARDPGVIEQYGLGNVWRSRDKAGNLGAEAWFDVQLVRNFDARQADLDAGWNPLLPRIEKGELVELSTGIAEMQKEDAAGTHNGRAYTWVARRIKPDHLAILPDREGACSTRDGCGINNQTGEVVKLLQDIANATKTMDGKELPASAFAYVPDPAKPSTWKLRIDDAAHVGGAIAALGKGFRGQKVRIPAGAMAAVKAKVRAAWKKFHPDMDDADMPMAVRNELSHDALRMKLGMLLRDLYTQNEPMCYIQEVYDDSIVYEHGGELYRVKFARTGDEVTLDGEPVEVERTITYEAVAETDADEAGGETVENEGDNPMKLTPEQKATLVGGLVNCSCKQLPTPWQGKDAAALNALSDDTLAAYGEMQKALAGQPPAPAPATVTNAAPPPAVPPSGAKKPFVEMLADYPEEKYVWNSVMEMFETQRQGYIEKLVANIENDAARAVAVEEYGKLPAKSVKRLAESMTATAPARQQTPEVLNFLGLTGGPVSQALVTEPPLGVFNYADDYKPKQKAG